MNFLCFRGRKPSTLQPGNRFLLQSASKFGRSGRKPEEATSGTCMGAPEEATSGAPIAASGAATPGTRMGAPKEVTSGAPMGASGAEISGAFMGAPRAATSGALCDADSTSTASRAPGSARPPEVASSGFRPLRPNFKALHKRKWLSGCSVDGFQPLKQRKFIEVDR